MSVIVWDGNTLAADKMASDGNRSVKATKVRKINGDLVGGVGSLGVLAVLFDWYERGAKVDDYPDCQKDKDAWSYLLVIKAGDRKIREYGNQPIPYLIEEPFYAVGSGAEIATGALIMGATSRQAVDIACQISPNCGLGVDEIAFK